MGNFGAAALEVAPQAGRARKIANFQPLRFQKNGTDRQSGERRERIEWHRIVVFNEGLADVVNGFVSKGSKVYIEGTLRTRKWQGQDGKDNYTTEVVLEGFNSNLTMLDSRGSDGGQSDGQGNAPGYRAPAEGGQSGGLGSGYGSGSAPSGAPDLDDEIPF